MAGRDGLLVRILGRLDASDGDAEIDLGGRRQRAVLAVLVLARGEIVPAERIADCLWGADLPGNASGAVQSYVSHLRRRLQPDGAPRSRRGIIASAGSGYAVRLPPDAVDAWWFERLVRDAGTASTAGEPQRAAELLTCMSSRQPTITSAGVAASDGTTDTSGVRNSASTNSSPVTTLASPVRAPSATPAVLST